MKKRIETILMMATLCLLTCCLFFTTVVFGQEAPKPGEVIDKANYKKYSQLFPEWFLPGFEDGWGELFDPITIKVSTTTSSPPPKKFLELSEKNRGKYTIDDRGFVAGGWDYQGLPFPGLARDDQQFAVKLMYNNGYRYDADDSISYGISMSKRKGESVRFSSFKGSMIFFINRLYDQPGPYYETPNGLQRCRIMLYQEPAAIKNLCMLEQRFLDPTKNDMQYMYLPTLRRAMRGDSKTKSTPVAGSVQATDDTDVFSGKVQDFKYAYVGEQSLLAVVKSDTSVEIVKEAGRKSQMYFPKDNWEVRKFYIIDIVAKDPNYPQSKKRIWVDAENYMISYGCAYDRAGQLWKIWTVDAGRIPLPDGDSYPYIRGMMGTDIQFGMGTYFSAYSKETSKFCGNKFEYADFVPAVLNNMGR